MSRVSKAVLNFLLQHVTCVMKGIWFLVEGINICATFQTNPRQIGVSVDHLEPTW